MELNNRRNAIIIGLIILVLIIFGLISFFNNKDKPIEKNLSMTKITDKIFNPHKLTDGNIISFTQIESEGNYIIKFDPENGNIISKSFTNTPLPDFVYWSDDDNYALVQFEYEPYSFGKYNTDYYIKDNVESGSSVWLYKLSTQEHIFVKFGTLNSATWDKTNNQFITSFVKDVFENDISTINLNAKYEEKLILGDSKPIQLSAYDNQLDLIIIENYEKDYGKDAKQIKTVINLQNWEKIDTKTDNIGLVSPDQKYTAQIIVKDTKSNLKILDNQKHKSHQIPVITKSDYSFEWKNNTELVILSEEENLYIRDMETNKTYKINADNQNIFRDFFITNNTLYANSDNYSFYKINLD